MVAGCAKHQIVAKVDSLPLYHSASELFHSEVFDVLVVNSPHCHAVACAVGVD